MYEIQVNTDSFSISGISSTWGNSTAHYNCTIANCTICNPAQYYYYSSIPWTATVTVYKYQVKCPKCTKTNWLELDKVESCTKCKSQLKAVSQKVDYEIQVDK